MRLHGVDPQDARDWVESLVTRLVEAGLLDDAAYAAARARALHRRGVSHRGLCAQLRAKGIEQELIDRTLAALGAGQDSVELEAAVSYARRRRLGPYRPSDRRAAWRQRDLAALGRQGFAFALARRVIDAPDQMSLEQELGRGGWAAQGS